MSHENPVYNLGNDAANESLQRVNEVAEKFEYEYRELHGVKKWGERLPELSGKISGLNSALVRLDKEKHARFLTKLKIELTPILVAVGGFGAALATGEGSLINQLGVLSGIIGTGALAVGTGVSWADVKNERNRAASNAKWTEIQGKELENALFKLEAVIDESRNEVARRLVDDGGEWIDPKTGEVLTDLPSGERHARGAILNPTEDQLRTMLEER